MGRFWSFVDEGSLAVDHSGFLSQKIWGKPARRAVQWSSLERPREETKSSGSFNRKVLPDWTDPPDLRIGLSTELVNLFFQCELIVKNDTETTNCTGKGDVSLTRKYKRRKINFTNRTCQKNLCFVVTSPKFTLNYPDLHIRNAGFAGPWESELFKRKIRFV